MILAWEIKKFKYSEPMSNVSTRSKHPAAVAHRNNSLEQYNNNRFGPEYTAYYFTVKNSLLLEQKEKPKTYQFFYAEFFTYVACSRLQSRPIYVNCIEFIQRVLFENKIDIHFVCVLFKKFKLYLPMLWNTRSTLPRIPIEQMQSALKYRSRQEILNMLDRPRVELHIVRVWVSTTIKKIVPILGPHFCIVIGSETEYFSASVGDILSEGGRTTWKNVYVSVPDPLFVACFQNSFNIFSTVLEDTHAMKKSLRLL